MAKLNPNGKPFALVSALANSPTPLSVAQLREATGGFARSTLWRLSGMAYHSGWSKHPLINRVSHGKYEVTALGRAALKGPIPYCKPYWQPKSESHYPPMQEHIALADWQL